MDVIFGNDRPYAAIRTINELAAARAAIADAGWVASDAAYQRLADTQAARDAYLEYGDTFRGH